jgi:hypothetical protein
MVVGPPNYRSTGKSGEPSCAFCVQYRTGMNRLATCAEYRCLVLLTSVCDAYVRRMASDPPVLTHEEEERLSGPWMKYPEEW